MIPIVKKYVNKINTISLIFESDIPFVFDRPKIIIKIIQTGIKLIKYKFVSDTISELDQKRLEKHEISE